MTADPGAFYGTGGSAAGAILLSNNSLSLSVPSSPPVIAINDLVTKEFFFNPNGDLTTGNCPALKIRYAYNSVIFLRNVVVSLIQSYCILGKCF